MWKLNPMMMHWLLLTITTSVFGEGKTVEILPRDPTQPLHQSVRREQQRELTLQAIFTRGEIRMAVINGVNVKVGDRVAGARILVIDEKSVEYERSGMKGRLSLRASVIKQK